MKLSSEKKQAIILYILEKIDAKEKGISSAVVSNFHIDQATFYKYINELKNEKLIKKVSRGEYELVTQTYEYKLSRKGGDLDWDTDAYVKCLQEHIREYENNVERIWTYVFCEMTNNIMDHSNAENVRVIVEKNYLSTRVWLIDNGIGIFKKIKEFFNLPGIEEAVDELFKGKVTTDKKNHSGEGIFFSSRMMDEFYILSDGKLFSHNKYNQELLETVKLPFKTGTAVVMKLSNFTQKTPKDIFAQFENGDGEFSKTEIKLKLIFDADPVSRSQAKRLCNGLNNFKDVILDFEDIEWMGQGFADQIFRVFAAENAGIKITPINMNEDVERMYKHSISG